MAFKQIKAYPLGLIMKEVESYSDLMIKDKLIIKIWGFENILKCNFGEYRSIIFVMLLMLQKPSHFP